MTKIDLAEVVSFMIFLAKKAGEIQMANYGKPYKTEWEKQHIRTEIDRRVGEMVREEISKKYPDFAILSEELPEKTGNEIVLVADEIDGTIQYFRGLSNNFCFSIGLCRDRTPLAGAVYAPKRDELYVGSEMGAFLNGQPIQVGQIQDITKVLMDISSGKHNRDSHLPFLKSALSENGISGPFHPGSFALSLCMVACGKLDALLATSPEPEDVAGGVPIAKAAGAKVTNLKGEPWQLGDPIFVANPVLHEKLGKFFWLWGWRAFIRHLFRFFWS